MKEKGESALEFLTDYGWAFLVIIFMVAALTYFGVLDPDKFLTSDENQNLSISELSCDDIKHYYIFQEHNMFTFNETYEYSESTRQRALFMEFIDRCYNLITVQ